ncbi:hypothetical protein GGF46_005000, partial [Coemansia sp. RSA 552]
ATPHHNYPHMGAANTSYYSGLSGDNQSRFIETKLDIVWTRAGFEGKQADWADYIKPDGRFKNEDIDGIIGEYRTDYIRKNAQFRPANEDDCQIAVNVLFKAVERHHDGMSGNPTQIFWHDRHASPVKGGMGGDRKPDGVLSSARDKDDVIWRKISGAVELKHADLPFNDGVLRGQVLRNFVDMAGRQPRRYSVGVSMAQGCVLYLYVCTPCHVWESRIGKLPGPFGTTADICEDNRRVIRVLLGAYEILSGDMGFVVKTPMGMHGRFSLDEIPGLAMTKGNASAMIKLDNAEGVLGRHRQLFGVRSWVKGAYCVEQGAEPVACYFKFNWSKPGKLETDIHQAVLDMHVPNVPVILHAGTINVPDSNEVPNEYPIHGEVLVLGNAGKPFDLKFGALVHDQQAFVNVIAGYLHTMFVAATGNGRQFALHRDISAGNLLVDEDNRPWVIDWGLGLVAPSKGVRRVSTDPQLGTAAFMSLRVLKEMNKRSLVDDLESLFLVVSYCAWGQYGINRDQQGGLWDRKATTGNVVSARMAWLFCEEAYFSHMGLDNNCPDYLKQLLGDMRRLLFSETELGAIWMHPVDPRDKSFDAHRWVLALKGVLGIEDVLREQMPQLHALVHYVSETPGCCHPYTADPTQELSDSPTEDLSLFAESASRGGAKRRAAETPTQASKRRTVGNRLGKRSETGLTDGMDALDTKDALYDGPSDDNDVLPSLPELLGDSPMARPVARPSRDRIHSRAQRRFLGERPSGSSWGSGNDTDEFLP